MTEQRQTMNRVRGVGCTFFLLLLAVCGYIGAQREPVQTVGVEVTRSVFSMEEVSDSLEDTALRLSTERTREIELLRGVLEDPASSEATKESASAQLAQIAERMDVEAQCTACLGHMGYEHAAAVYGAQMLTVFIPAAKVSGESDKTRILDALCSLTGIEAADIKIILTKK